MNDDALYVVIGGRIKQARKAAGLTQADIAERTGYLRSTIANIERGGQSLAVHSMLGIAAALGVSLAALLPFEPIAGQNDVYSEAILQLKQERDEAVAKVAAIRRLLSD